MQDLEILAVAKTYTKETVIGMGALKGAPCTVQGVVDNGDGTQTLTLKWTDTSGTDHTSDITLPSAIFEITNVQNGQTLRYNSTSGKFENSNVSFSADLGDLDDVVITSAQNGQALTYDAANNRWINADGSTVAALSDLTDVVISTLQNGQFLAYDSTSGKWVNATLEINARDVDYDNTTSGLTATDVQGAIDEIVLDVSQLSASKIGYDGTASGLSANKVQGAIDELADEKVDKETGKGLSANDFTDALKTKLDNIESGAQVNVIETVKVNGTALTPDANKAVNIEEKVSKLSDVDLTGLADGMILIYDAANDKWYAGANTGASYTAGEGIEIDQNNVISSKMVLFTGTEAQWAALPLADKKKFTHYATNDDQTGQIDAVPTQNSNNLMTSGGIYNALQDKANVSDLGTAAAKDSTNAVTQSSTDLVESGAVYTAIDNAVKALDVTDAAVAGSYVTAVSETDGAISVTREAADAAPTEDSNKLLKSGGAFTALADKADKVTGATANNFAGLDANGNLQDSGKKAADFATAQELADEAATRSAMGAKNLFRVMNASQVINGIEWVVNNDGTITANGTATEESKFTAQSKSAATHYYDENMMKAIAGKTIRYSGCPSGGSSSTYLFRLYIANAGGSTDEYGEGAERTIISDFLERNFSVECIIKSGQTATNLTFKPMICLASDTDTTYQPYSKTNKQLTDDTASAVANVPNGAINLAKPVSARTTTVNDVEFVIDSEGKVTANGTASANIRFDMAEVTLKAGRTYQLFEPSSLQARRPLNPEGYRCYARIKSSGVWVLQSNGWRDSYTPSSDVVVSVGIAMQSGNQVTDEVFAPMLVLYGTDVGDTFYPYAKTNKELTDGEVYSEAETKTNKVWIDGKPIYRKVVDLGTLPNTTTKSVAHGITNIGTFVHVSGFCIGLSNEIIPLPLTWPTATSIIGIYATTVNVVVNAAMDRTNYTGYAILEYTKTTS